MYMKLYLGADHGGFTLKQTLIAWLRSEEHDAVDCGNTVLDPDDDFPDFAFSVADHVAADPASFGIVLCRSAGGVTVAANKVKGIRCVTAVNEKDVTRNRRDDDANVIALAGDYMSEETAKELVRIFINTAYEPLERHVRRIAKITAREQSVNA
jgi:ribose 5-phosphate isomerase B